MVTYQYRYIGVEKCHFVPRIQCIPNSDYMLLVCWWDQGNAWVQRSLNLPSQHAPRDNKMFVKVASVLWAYFQTHPNQNYWSMCGKLRRLSQFESKDYAKFRGFDIKIQWIWFNLRKAQWTLRLTFPETPQWNTQPTSVTSNHSFTQHDNAVYILLEQCISDMYFPYIQTFWVF